jgi:O-antigen ligase
MQMLLLLLPCLALRIKSWQRGLLLFTLLLAAYDLLGSESRGGWTGALIGIGIILVVSIAKKWLSLKAIATIFISVSILGVIFSGTIIARLSADDNGAADARGPLMQIASNMISANPVVGVGWNNFGLALYDYIEIDQFGAWLNLVHNGWLLIWSETGTISFGLFVAFWLAIAWHAIKLIRKGQQFYGLLALGILASMAGAATHMMVEIFASRVLAQIIWTNAALITAMIRMQQQEDALLVNDLSSANKGIQSEQHALQTGR